MFGNSLIDEIKKLKNRMPFEFQRVLMLETEVGAKVNNPWEYPFNTNDKIISRSGRLIRSFSPKDKDTLTNIKLRGTDIDGTLGSNLPYASVQDKGMFVKSKGNMHKYFYAMYKISNNKIWFRMFLSVKKRGGVNIKGRGYFSNSVSKFQKLLDTMGYNLLNKFINLANDLNG